MGKSEMVYMETTKLKLNPKNPRKNDGAVATVMKSIEKYGFKNPLIADSNLVVYCGNTRLKAAKKLGIKEVPVIIADDLTPEQIREYALIDNKSSEIAEWDFELLQEELDELDFSDFDLDWGIGDPPAEAEEDDYDVEGAVAKIDEPRTHLGDIYQLGDHRLMCGDSTKPEDVQTLMNGASADLLLTDPPYNVDYEGKTSDKLKIENDKQSDADFRAFLQAALSCAKDVMKPGAAFYIWHADSEGYNFRGACVDAGLTVHQCLIWKKNGMVLGRQDYQWQHEPCLYGWKDGAAHKWYSDRKQTTILEFDKPLKSEEHPTMKPVPLFAYLMQNSTQAGELTVDLFAGSGTAIIAGEQLKRKVYAMELDPKYCDVIIERWENLTKNKAVKLHCAEGQEEQE